MKKVSVIVPVYNTEKYLYRCIESILDQTYKMLELILIDDGSTDSSGIICDEVAQKDTRVKVLHKKNEGAGEARNCGINIAQGEYICFVDSDDYISSRYIEIMLHAAEKYDCGIVQCDFLFGNEENYSFIEEEKEDEEPVVLDNREAFETRKTKIIICAKLYKVELFNNIRYPKLSIHDDEFITYKLIYNSKNIALLSRALYYYYNSNGSIMRTKKEYYPENFIEAYDERIEYFRDKNEKQLELISYKEKCVRLAQIYGKCIGDKNNKNDKKHLLKLYHEDYKIAKKARMSRKEALFLKAFLICPRLMSVMMRHIGFA